MGGLHSARSRRSGLLRAGRTGYIFRINKSNFQGPGMNFPSLFSPLKIGPYQLKHRLAMAPLTRMRAEKPSLAPRPLNAEYYAQRATPGGLIIAEASPVTATGFGSPGVPGIYSERQVEGWREGRRCGSCQGRDDLSPALACRAGLAFLVPARRRAAGGAFGGGDAAGAEDVDGRRKGRRPTRRRARSRPRRSRA